MDGARLLEHLKDTLASCIEHAAGNVVSEEMALEPGVAGLKMFDAPLVGVAAADDPLFVEAQKPYAVGPQMKLPSDWLPGAKTVVSYFIPISERVRMSNRGEGHASPEWFHARIDGQSFVLELGRQLVALVEEAGYTAVCPAASTDMQVMFLNADEPAHSFFSNWSERHVAYIAGLGTFSLSKGLITERGMAGRIGSIVTTAELPVTQRPYKGLYDYCIRCGACIAKCPVGAISLEAGKDHYRCFEEMTASKQYYPGYLGCGKCQVGVPCEFKKPL